MSFIIYNGKLFQKDEPIITAANRGLRYGDGIFETMLWQKNSIQLSNEHFARLWKGMKLLQFEIPTHFTPELLETQTKKIIPKNNIKSLARVRLTIIRGNGGLYDAQSNAPNYIIECWAIDGINFNTNGLTVGLYSQASKTCNEFSNIKCNNCLPYILGALYAKKQKWNDAIIINQYGNICETTIANLFLVKDKIVYTPAITEGCVDGVMRNTLITLLKQHNIEVITKSLTITDLLEADEAFTTNSIYVLKWIKQFENKIYTNHFCQKIFSLFIEQFG